MPIPRKPSICLVAMTALACSALILAKSKDQDKNADFTLTSRTEMVLVPTVVTDKSGSHISGLKKEDFRVLQNGSEQKIATFEEISSDTHRWKRSDNPNGFSNVSTDRASPGRITLIVLDFVNTGFADQVYARGELLKYLARSTDQREPTALYTLTRSGIHVIHDFTADPRILSAALHKVKGETFHMVDTPQDAEAATGTASPEGAAGLDPRAVQTEATKFQAMIEDREMDLQSFQQVLAITDTLQGMQALAQAFKGFPVRKSLIWVSGGFPFSVNSETMLPPPGRYSLADVESEYEHTWQLLSDAQISLYPVDAKGLQAGFADASIGNPGSNFTSHAISTQMDTLMTFQTFASMTGGRAYVNRNDLDRGFHEAASDSSQYYMLGYYLDRSNAKPGWCRLAVKVQREHVTVRARNGFFIAKTAPDPNTSRDRDVTSAMQSPLEYTAIALVAQWLDTQPGKEPGKKHVNYDVHLEPDAMILNGADNNHMVLEFIAQVKSPDGKLVGGPEIRKIDGHANPERMAAFRQRGIDGVGGLNIAPGEYTVRFMVRDDLSGRIGTVDAPLKVE